jgi:hypothetical protein
MWTGVPLQARASRSRKRKVSSGDGEGEAQEDKDTGSCDEDDDSEYDWEKDHEVRGRACTTQALCKASLCCLPDSDPGPLNVSADDS